MTLIDSLIVVSHERKLFIPDSRGVSRTAATSKMERFVIIVNGFQLLTIISKRSILDVAVVLDPPQITQNTQKSTLRESYWVARDS